MVILEEWNNIGADLKNEHFAFIGVKLNRNFANFIPNFTNIME
jgi:hypothetical protein